MAIGIRENQTQQKMNNEMEAGLYGYIVVVNNTCAQNVQKVGSLLGEGLVQGCVFAIVPPFRGTYLNYPHMQKDFVKENT